MIYLVVGYRPECSKALRKKLLAFGLTPGTELEIIRAAPLGDPIEIKLRGFMMSIRRAEFEMLDVKVKSCVQCTGCGV